MNMQCATGVKPRINRREAHAALGITKLAAAQVGVIMVRGIEPMASASTSRSGLIRLQPEYAPRALQCQISTSAPLTGSPVIASTMVRRSSSGKPSAPSLMLRRSNFGLRKYGPAICSGAS
jgi:hypothetical protein